MSDICRLCLSTQCVIHSIFDEKQLRQKIESCLPIKVSLSDKLPKKICKECSIKIDEIFKYCERAVSVEKQLLLSNDRDQISTDNNEEKFKTEIQIEYRIKEEPIEQNVVLNSRNNESVIVLNSSALRQVGNVDVKFSTKCTQTEPSLLETVESNKIIETQTKEVNVKIKEELDVDFYNDELQIEDNDNAEPYSSDDDLTLNKIVDVKNLKLKISSSRVTDIYAKKRKAKKKKKEGKDVLHEKRSRGRPKGSTNKKDKEKKVKVEDYNLENDAVRVMLETDGDKWFYPKGTAEEVKKWQCLMCLVYKQSRMELLQHYKDHVEKPWKCTKLGENGIKEEELIDIKKDVEDDDNRKSEKTEAAAKFGVHYTIVKSPEFHDAPAYQCLRCLKMFLNKRSVTRHLISHDDSRPFPCNICGRAYKRAYEILLHGRAHNGVKTLFCRYEQCNYSTVYRGALSSHHKRHEPNFKYTCEVCQKGFDVLTWFNEHKNVHTGSKPFTCHLCGKSFVYSRYLTSHRKTVHPETENGRVLLHRCPSCPKQFPHRKTLRAHQSREHGAQQSNSSVLCDICGKGLSSKEHLKFHRRTHTGEKPHACRTCGKAFVKKCNLTLHERVHSGEKPHVCSHCGKAFSQRSTLVIHERYHSGARPYQCLICNKGFVAKGLLSMHQKTCI